MLILNDELYFNEGTEQICYLHPKDKSKCIKISKNKELHSRLSNELKYTKKVSKKRTNSFKYPFFIRLHKEAKTNLGKGYIYDLIRDENTGNISKTYEYYLLEDQNRFTDNQLQKAFEELVNQMEIHRIIAHDIGISNIACKILKDGSPQFILVDGLGHRDFLPLVDWSSYFAKRKITRRIEKINLQTPRLQRKYQLKLKENQALRILIPNVIHHILLYSLLL